jgi:hypothetical protein
LDQQARRDKEEKHMVDTPPTPSTRDDTGVGPDDGGSPAYPGTPQWVKVSGIVVVGLVLMVFVVLLVTTALGLHTPGPGGHGR